MTDVKSSDSASARLLPIVMPAPDTPLGE